AELFFITDHKINLKQYNSVKSYGVRVLHLDDVLQYLVEHLEGAMPETDPLTLASITHVLTPPSTETEVPTSIVFARLIDFLNYMEDDPFDLLFARNVRLWLGKTETNKEIEATFKNNPKEFAYSNNGITLLCKSHKHEMGKRELTLENPRVVNGSQTLHSIRGCANPSPSARVMVRIIEIPSEDAGDITKLRARRRDIIHKISIRSNMQNPVKMWNLVSNDDYQNELSQHFWKKKLYYERRQNEWKIRRDDLKSIGISQGPEIRRLTQLIASYYYEKPVLGPANAQGQLNSLFDEDAYSIIRNTQPELAYRIWLLAEIIYGEIGKLRQKRQYLEEFSGYIKFSLFSTICRSIDKIYPHIWKEEAFEKYLEEQSRSPEGKWEKLTKTAADHVISFYKKEKKKASQGEWELTPANYFKSKSYMKPVIESKLPRNLTSLSKQLLSKLC
ncbi:MAG TPA: AIPR family protein, partial [Acidobacteriota bacterium]|nr:AIPR family protein [Acidobacteriota bacterium]